MSRTQSTTFNFKDNVAIVTGAGSGIGKSIAQEFAEAGAKVAIADINSESGINVLKGLERKGTGNAIFIRTDISDQASVNKMVEEVISTFGKVDFLINNAGIEFNKEGNIVSMPYDKMKRILDVDLYGPIHCIRAVVPEMLKNEDGGRIVTITSIQALGTHLPGTSYQVAKAGLIGLTKAAAIELAGSRITVNAIAPGAIATEGMGAVRSGDAGVIDAYRQRIPLGRRGNPYEVSGPTLFLCSKEASYITGAVVVVDGGYTSSITPDDLKPKYRAQKNDPDMT